MTLYKVTIGDFADAVFAQNEQVAIVQAFQCAPPGLVERLIAAHGSVTVQCQKA